MMRPKLDPDEFDTEKNVILEEISLYQDRPTQCLFENALSSYFGDHPAGNSVLGTSDSVSSLKVTDMSEYVQSKYVPENMIAVFSGNADWDSIVQQIIEETECWAGEYKPRKVKEHQFSCSSANVTRADLNKAYACLLSPGPSATEEFRYEAEVLSCLLGDSLGSRLYWKLVNSGLADTAAIDTDQMHGVGLFSGFVTCEPQDLDKVIEVTVDVLQNIGEISPDELSRAITKLSTRKVLQGESPLRRMISTGMEWTYRQKMETLESEISRIKAVTNQSLKELLEVYTLKDISVFAMTPE